MAALLSETINSTEKYPLHAFKRPLYVHAEGEQMRASALGLVEE